ncbi:MAG TPA: hypothetical protein VFL99_02120 [Segeticoccus sp.]|uniref:hypothetical protein n=1 Tax=Segeticoccus sp. TaxID=2706531 RepID=UPI002D7E4B52|nr:hypothetical protein [Segeticoccus sp.]HET8599093.1 hypothetical protein [Segeticoccus sp.]
MAGRSLRTAVVTVGTAIGVAASVGVAALGPSSAEATQEAAAVAAGPHDRVVTLPTGDRVRVALGADGRPRATVLTALPGTKQGQFATFGWGRDLYVVPRHAVSAAARQLSNFNVTRLAGLGAGSPTVTPHFPMQTLTLHAIDAAGKPDEGDGVVVVNVDDMRKYTGFVAFTRGIAKVSVPSGHYAAFGFFFDPRNGATQGSLLPQFTVTGDRSVTMDARRATSLVTTTTPRPARLASTSVSIARADTRGNVAEFVAGVDPSLPVRVQPVNSAPTVGELHYSVYSRLFSPRGVAPAYSYDVDFPSDGTIPADQHHVVRRAGLAAVRSTYTATRAGQQVLQANFAMLPWESFGIAELLGVRAPLTRTEYYSARPGLSWQGDVVTAVDLRTFDLLGEYLSPVRTYRPGARSSTVWGNGQPVTPVLLRGQVFPGVTICPACTNSARSRLYLFAFPFGDRSQHFGLQDWPTKGLNEHVSYAVYADGRPVARGSDLLDAAVALPTGTHRYRIDYDTVRSSSTFTLSTAVATSWTLPRKVSGRLAPRGWWCGDLSPTTGCRVLPLMTARYRLGADSLGRLAPGRHSSAITIAHLTGDGSPRVHRFSVQVSYDGGVTWRAATARPRGAGGYRVSLAVPPKASTNGFGALRISARDAVGGTLQQTIHRAFAVGP